MMIQSDFPDTTDAIGTYDASITQGFRPNFDKLDSCDCDCKLTDEKTARLLAKWLSRFPGDAILNRFEF